MTPFVPIRWLASAVIAAALVLLGSCGGDNGGPSQVVITAASPPAGTTGVAYPGYSFMASGGIAPLGWTESGPLPPGLGLSSSGQLNGTPTTAGTYPVMVIVADSSMPPLTVPMSVSLVVSDSSIVIAAAPTPPAGIVTYPYPGFSYSASGGSPPYTWKATGSVPPGLTVGPDGSVSGTPTAAGSFSFSVTATDSAQTPVSGPPLPTQIMISNPGPVVLNAMPAPPAAVGGSSYGFTFSTTGGYLPLSWRITAGALPPGLALGNDGSLSGMPTKVGTFNFTVTVTDSAPTPTMSSQPFAIMVAAPPPPTIANPQPPTGTVGSNYVPFQFSANGGLPPLVWTETGTALPGLSLSTGGILSGIPTAAGRFPITLEVTDADKQTAPAVSIIVRVSLARPAASFTPTGGLTVARSGHTATLLNSGSVLVAGGAKGAADPSAELYDPMAGTFTATGSMTEARIGHTATLLGDSGLPHYGEVLIVGSVDASAELYNPATGVFTATGSMSHARTSPSATLLSNTGPNAGKVLIVGGNTAAGDLTAELYDPAAGTFSATGSTTILRVGHTATLLSVGALAGRVLIAGGNGTATAELYNPATGMFTPTGSMTVARIGHTATRLGAPDGTQNGDVLIVGTDGSADLYDPGTGTFAAVGSLFANYPPQTSYRTASLRNDGTVLVAGGNAEVAVSRLVHRGLPYCLRLGFRPVSTSVAALFAPESDGFTETGFLGTSRAGHTATVLSDGTVLIVGGTQSTASPRCTLNPIFTSTVLSSAELFK